MVISRDDIEAFAGPEKQLEFWDQEGRKQYEILYLKMIAHKDNSNGTLFGIGIDWIDEEAYIYCSCQLNNDRVVT